MIAKLETVQRTISQNQTQNPHTMEAAVAMWGGV